VSFSVGWNKLSAVPAIQTGFDSQLPELRGACSSLLLADQKTHNLELAVEVDLPFVLPVNEKPVNPSGLTDCILEWMKAFFRKRQSVLRPE
jgi:hypothetical protein